MSSASSTTVAVDNSFPVDRYEIRKERLNSIIRYTLLIAVGILMLYPLIWLIGASFKSNAEIFTQVGFWPSSFDFTPYIKGWKTSTEYTFTRYFANSFLIVIPRIIVTVISCVLVAYAFARFDFLARRFCSASWWRR